MMFGTLSWTTANSIVAVTPPTKPSCSGTMLPALRSTNSWPGSACVSRNGSIRESLQVMTIACGRLAGGELGESLAVLRVHVALKGANAGDDVVHVPQSYA